MSEPIALRVGSRRILACRDTLVAGLATRSAGLHADPDGGTVDTTGMPRGVTVRAWTSLPAFVEPVRAVTLDDLHATAVGLAWRDGAWDIDLSAMPALSGPELGLITAHMDYSADPGLEDILVDAARRGRLATWFWLPMLGAAHLRRSAHAAKDATLRPDGGRDGEPLPRATAPLPDGRSTTIRLGRSLGRSSDVRRATARPAYSPPATRKQRACIAALHYAAGRRPDIPARLTLRQASAMIDALKGTGDGTGHA